MLNPTNALKTTVRKLIRDRFGERRLDQHAVHDAVDNVLRHGWLPVYVPDAADADRDLVLLPQAHRFAAVVRCLARDGCGTVPVGLIESRTGVPIDNSMTGIMLAKYGLTIMGVEGHVVRLRGTSPGFAHLVNLSRRDLLYGFPCCRIVEYATGMILRSRNMGEELRLRVALKYEEFLVDVPGLLDGNPESDLLSRWRFAPLPPPPPGPKTPVSDPHPPAAPFDPDIPPF